MVHSKDAAESRGLLACDWLLIPWECHFMLADAEYWLLDEHRRSVAAVKCAANGFSILDKSGNGLSVRTRRRKKRILDQGGGLIGTISRPRLRDGGRGFTLNNDRESVIARAIAGRREFSNCTIHDLAGSSFATITFWPVVEEPAVDPFWILEFTTREIPDTLRLLALGLLTWKGGPIGSWNQNAYIAAGGAEW